MSGIEITEVSVHLCQNQIPDSPMLGFARIILNDVFAINGIRILQGKGGKFLAFPREKKQEKVYNICYPINKAFGNEMTKLIIDEYNLLAEKESGKLAALGVAS